MLDFDELQELERARVVEDEEEKLKEEVEREAEKTLELEAKAKERLERQAYEENGKPGILFMVNSGDTTMFFFDAVSKALRSSKKMFDADRQRFATNGGKGYLRRLEILAAFLNWLILNNYFVNDDATAANFQKIAASFQSENGLKALYQRLSACETQRKASDIRDLVDKEFKRILACARRLLAAMTESVPNLKDSLIELYTETLALLFPKTPLPISGRWYEQGVHFSVEDELEIVLHVGQLENSRMLIMNGTQTVQDLQDHLVADLGLPKSIQLFGSAGPLFAKWSLRASPTVISVSGVTEFEQSLESPIDGSMQDPHWLQMWRSLGVFKLFKATAVSATRILYELRDHFTEDNFQAKYAELKKISDNGNEAHQELLSMTWNVQKKILPMYGYAATPVGLSEMREDIARFAGWNIWKYEVDYMSTGREDEVVWKVRKDIHYVLDMGGKLPQFQVQNMAAGDAWLLWAKLVAAYDTACFRAARLIAKADILLLCTGAGFSADSGLAVYADVAKVQAYAERGLEYRDLCDMFWLREEPELFWGFWGQCYNDYRETAPHKGFAIISDWVDRFFRNSPTAQQVRKNLAARDRGPSFQEPYEVVDYAGAFFVFTSNVDTHHYDWFRAEEIRECHGNTELFQCAGMLGHSCEKVWRSPREYKFQVDKETMLAPKTVTEQAAVQVRVESEEVSAYTPVIGHVRGGGRPNAMRYMPDPPREMQTDVEQGFVNNHPICPFCAAPARPAIMMFNDSGFRDVSSQSIRWQDWVKTVTSLMKDQRDEPIEAVILEIGAGSRVPTVRTNSEQQLRSMHEAGADVHLVRINPELPLGDAEDFAPNGELSDLVLSIIGGGLKALSRINALMPQS